MMTIDEIEIVIHDLCARLPYKVKCERCGKAYELVEIDIKRGLVYLLRDDLYAPTFMPYSITSGDEVKPYLRPMSDMTEEEKKTWKMICSMSGSDMDEADAGAAIDWLNARHFDFRGLIEKGLALKAPEGMYVKEEKK